MTGLAGTGGELSVLNGALLAPKSKLILNIPHHNQQRRRREDSQNAIAAKTRLPDERPLRVRREV